MCGCRGATPPPSAFRGRTATPSWRFRNTPSLQGNRHEPAIRFCRAHPRRPSVASLCAVAHGAAAQPPRRSRWATQPPAVTLSASATASVPNDRMLAWMRAEADNADAAAAANSVNTRMGKALARAKATKGVDASTSGYSSYQITEKNQPSRWRVAQTLEARGQRLRGIVRTDFAVAGRRRPGRRRDAVLRQRRRAREGGGSADPAGDQGVAGARDGSRARIRIRRLARGQGRDPDRRLRPPATA